MTARRLTALGLLALAVWAAGCGRRAEDPVVARVNQRPITQRELWEAIEQADNGEVGRRTLDALIVRQLVRQEAETRGIRLDEAEVQSRIAGLRDYILAGTGLDFATWLERTGQTEEEVVGRIRLQMLTAKLVLPERDRQAYFEEKREALQELPHNNEAVIYRHIVVASREDAEAVRQQIIGGGDFAELAQERSLDPITRARGGMVGWMAKGKSADAELEKTLFSLQPGEVSEPLRMQLPQPEGAEALERWRIVKVERHFPPQELTLEANADVIEEWMMSDPGYQLQLQEFFDDLRAKANVEILSPRYLALQEAYQQRRDARERRLGAQPPAGPLLPEMGGPSPPPAEQNR